MSHQVSPSAHRPYGVLRVTRVWGTSRATLYRRRRRCEPSLRRRPGPLGPLPDEALVEAIRQLLADSPFHGEGYRKVWARLRFAGIRTSKRRVLRLMRAHGLLAPGRVGRPHGPKAHDGMIRTERVDEMWGTDLTSTPTGEGQASIFVTVDHCSTECLGIHAARYATRFEALEPLRQGLRACFGGFAAGVAGGLKLRHDHGSQFVADDYQRELAFLGIESIASLLTKPALSVEGAAFDLDAQGPSTTVVAKLFGYELPDFGWARARAKLSQTRGIISLPTIDLDSGSTAERPSRSRARSATCLRSGGWR
jgi:putative transposase